MMFSTPDISHLSSVDYECVYEPAEDSFLFLDALEKENEYLNNLRPLVSLEIGSGSGIVSTFLISTLKSKPFCLCTDINEKAAAVTKRTGSKNKTLLHPVLTDLASSLLCRLRHSVDVLLFNPPYVVTPSEEVGSKGIEASWAGGTRGREVIDRFLPQITELLSPSGVCYLVIIKENDAGEISSVLAEKYNIKTEDVLSRKSGPEHLSVLKITRNCINS